jgi:lysophospholipase L1-like esterase
LEVLVFNTRFPVAVCLLLTLARAPARADTMTTIAALGDSLSDPYAGYTGKENPMTGFPYWGNAGDKNWVEQFRAARGNDLAVANFARAGATSAELLAQGQHTAVADMIRGGKLGHAAMLVGTSDMFLALQSDERPEVFIAKLAANFDKAVSTLNSAGKVALVVGNIPNLTMAPAVQIMVNNNAEALGMIRNMVQAANTEIARVAAAHGVPLVDLYRLSNLSVKAPTLGGTQLEPGHFFAPDLLHPSTVMQGLIGNTILEAMRRAYGMDIWRLRLSNEEILRLAGLPAEDGQTYYDVSSYVVHSPHHAPEPSTLVLCVAAGLVGVGRWGCRCVRRRAA